MRHVLNLALGSEASVYVRDYLVLPDLLLLAFGAIAAVAIWIMWPRGVRRG